VNASAFPDPLVVLDVTVSPFRGREGKGEKRGKGREGRQRGEREGKEHPCC